MATKIVTKNSSTASAVPTASDLVQGELAVNVADKRLFTEDNAGAIVELGTNPSGNVTFQDNGKAIFGAGDDLQIYHDGSNSYINDAGTGNLYIDSSDTIIRANGTENSAKFIGNGRVELYYDAVKKFETTASGISVDGTATMDGLTVDGYVGIGTGSPSSYFSPQLVVHSSSNLGGITIRSNATTDTNYLLFADGTSGNERYRGYVSYDHNADAMKLATGASPAITIDSSQNVGIGTSSPQGLIDLTVSVAKTATGGATFAQLGKTNESSGYASLQCEVKGGASAADRKWTFQTIEQGVANAGSIVLQPDGGNVGIGNSIPSSFNGNANNLVIGTGSGSEGLTIYGGGESNIFFADGTAGSSAYVGRIEYSHAVDNMLFYVNNANAMTIDSSGRLGLGVTPEAWSSVFKVLRVGTGSSIAGESGGTSTWFNTNAYYDGSWKRINTNTSAQIAHTSDGKQEFKVAAAGSAGGAISWNTAMTVDNSGNLLVGRTSAGNTGNGHSIRGGDSVIFSRDSSGESMQVCRNASAGDLVRFICNGVDKGSIDFDGSNTVSYTTSSDQRLKENIADADDAGSKIDAIQVRKYDWKVDGSHQDYGMVAQELLEVAPEAVSGDADSEEMMGVDYSKLVPMLIKEIQSLRNRVAQLEE